MTHDFLWTARSIADPADLEAQPPVLAPQEAQQWCNFVLWTPGGLAADLALLAGTLRLEAPPGRIGAATAGRTPWSANNPAAYRFEVSGADRSLRVKEFLYDWAFPALDHPCLWDSPTRAVPLDERYVLWFGTDYLGHRAASARLARTTIELSVLSGEFSDDEILGLYRTLRPVDETVASMVYATPLGMLSYFVRYAEATMPGVPIGLWLPDRPGGHQMAWAGTDTDAQRLLAELDLPAEIGGLSVDGAARFSGRDGCAEIEVVYAGPGGESSGDRGHELRLIAARAGGSHLTVPPQPTSHPASRDTVTVVGVPIHLAWIDERYGPFDAVLVDPAAGLEARLLSSTGIGLDRAWFSGALAQLIKGCRAAATAR